MDLSGLAQKSMSTLSLRGTISNTDPLLPFAWIEKRKDGKWHRLPEHEQEHLEACFQNMSGVHALNDRSKPAIVPLAAGRAEAHLYPRGSRAASGWAGCVVQRYSELPPTELARTRWCFKPPRGVWTPFAPSEDDALEMQLTQLQSQSGRDNRDSEHGVFQDATSKGMMASGLGIGLGLSGAGAASSEIASGLVTADGLYEVRLCRGSVPGSGAAGDKDGAGGPSASALPSPGSSATVYADMKATQTSGWLGRAHCSVSRGWAGEASAKRASEAEIRAEMAEPTALVLVVHGIGEALWRKDDAGLPFRSTPDLEESVDMMRSLANKLLAESLSGEVAAPSVADSLLEPFAVMSALSSSCSAATHSSSAHAASCSATTPSSSAAAPLSASTPPRSSSSSLAKTPGGEEFVPMPYNEYLDLGLDLPAEAVRSRPKPSAGTEAA